MEIETIPQCIGTQSLKSKVHIKPTPAMKEMVFHQVMHATTEWIGNINKKQNYAYDIACKTMEIASVANIHTVLSISI